MQSVPLLSLRTTNGNNGGNYILQTHIFSIASFGTFNGCTVALEVSLNNGTNYVFADDTAFTAEGVKTIQLKPGAYLRGNVTNAGASTNISLVAFGESIATA